MLQKLLEYGEVAIQCHNIPDADSLASGFALHQYFTMHGKSPLFFYTGPAITKPNLVGMITKLHIPIEHQPQRSSFDGLLITVDCQYGMGNVTKVEAPHIAVIDHHIQEDELPALCDLRPWLGSCATLVWDLLVKQDFTFDTNVSTALLYGLFMDTNGFSELNHPLDRDMWDALRLEIDKHIFKTLKLSNLTLDDLFQVSLALSQLQTLNNNLRTAIIPALPCDPNILGLIGDLAMQVNDIDNVVAYSIYTNNDVKFSVRTSTNYSKASDIACWLAHTYGSGGGHREKAGGYINNAKFKNNPENLIFDAYCKQRLYEYYEKHVLLDCLRPETSIDWLASLTLKRYRKRILTLGYVNTVDTFGSNVDLHIRTLEGDVVRKSCADTFLMIGIEGEVYPIERAVFEKNYTYTNESHKAEFQYAPTVLNTHTGRRVSLLEHAHVCYSKGVSCIQAVSLKKHQYLKIFTSWDRENYYSGKHGDWFVMLTQDDFYIVAKDIFPKLYLRDFTDERLAMLPKAVQIQNDNQQKAYALKIEEEFCVTNPHDGEVLYGEAYQWLIQYVDNRYDIVSQNNLETNFTIIKIGKPPVI